MCDVICYRNRADQLKIIRDNKSTGRNYFFVFEEET